MLDPVEQEARVLLRQGRTNIAKHSQQQIETQGGGPAPRVDQELAARLRF